MNYETRLMGKGDSPEILSEEEELTRRNRKRLIIIGAVLAVLAVAALVYFKSGGADEPAAGDAARSIPAVTVMIPGRQSIERVISATGTLAARREMPVGVAGEGGMVVRVLVEPGQWVGAGQVLATIDRSVQSQTDASLSAQINVARADARIAQSELDRAQSLLARGFVSKADIDRKAATRDAANARVRVAEAQASESRARTGRLDIRAPAAGLVLTRAVEPGQVVSSGSGVLFRMAKAGEMELLARLSEGDLAAVSLGKSATVTPVGTNQNFTGQIWQVSPIIDEQTRQGIARIALTYNPALRPGGFAAARIVSGTREAPLLPESAVQSDNKGNYVYLIDAKDTVVRRDVTVGDVSDVGVAIISGLSGTERVVMSAAAFLNPGEKVKPTLTKAAR